MKTVSAKLSTPTYPLRYFYFYSEKNKTHLDGHCRNLQIKNSIAKVIIRRYKTEGTVYVNK